MAEAAPLAPAVPPPIDNRFVAPGCEQFGTRADAESLLTMLRATLDEYMRLAAAPAVHPDEFTCPYCFDQGAAPAVPDDIAAIIACLGDDAALLRETTDDSEEIAQNMDDAAAALERLSAAPAVREPLTDEQTDEIWDRFEQAPTMGYRYFVTRAILAAVGIGGGGNG